jgi:hypothetical protein
MKSTGIWKENIQATILSYDICQGYIPKFEVSKKIRVVC